jgi:hypothetical protein
MSISCQSLADLETALHEQFNQMMQSLVPELIHSQFQFSVAVSLPISGMADEVKDSYGFTPSADSAAENENEVLQLSLASAVAHLADAKLKLKRQRAVSREILKTIQAVDGFRYLEKEAWDTKHFDGYRFKYLCRDSYQNKDRVSNRARMAAASDSPSTAAPKPEREGRGRLIVAECSLLEIFISSIPLVIVALAHVFSIFFHLHSLRFNPKLILRKDNRLPTYDCRGSIFIKFSSSQGLVDVIYQHFPIHRESMPVTLSKKRGREKSPVDLKYET